jgi:hypothetical protein
MELFECPQLRGHVLLIKKETAEGGKIRGQSRADIQAPAVRPAALIPDDNSIVVSDEIGAQIHTGPAVGTKAGVDDVLLQIFCSTTLFHKVSSNLLICERGNQKETGAPRGTISFNAPR